MHVGLTRCGIAVETTERWEACEWSPKKINLRKDHAFSSGIIAVAAKSERRESEPCDCIDTNSEKISDVWALRNSLRLHMRLGLQTETFVLNKQRVVKTGRTARQLPGREKRQLGVKSENIRRWLWRDATPRRFLTGWAERADQRNPRTCLGPGSVHFAVGWTAHKAVLFVAGWLCRTTNVAYASSGAGIPEMLSLVCWGGRGWLWKITEAGRQIPLACLRQ